MIGRLILGVLKGLVLGALVGFGLAAAGMAVPGALVAYPAALAVGVLMALVAGKPIWAKDARVEVMMKAGAGALLGPGFMWLARRFLTMGLPLDVSTLPGLGSAAGQAITLGTFAVTSLALVAAILGGFYDADHEPQAAPAGDKKDAAAGQRVAAAADEPALDAAELDAEVEAPKEKRQS
jgi:hypothetical protein